MRSIALVYLAERFFYRIWSAITSWYVGGFLAVSGRGLEVLERLDRSLALKITARNLFKPLYQDQTFIGRVLGFGFRFVRVLMASLLYLFIIAAFIFAYLVWAFLPLYIILGNFGR